MSDTPVTTQSEAQQMLARIKATRLPDPSLAAVQPVEHPTAKPAPPQRPEGYIDPTPGRGEHESLQAYYARNPSLAPKPPPNLLIKPRPPKGPLAWSARGKFEQPQHVAGATVERAPMALELPPPATDKHYEPHLTLRLKGNQPLPLLEQRVVEAQFAAKISQQVLDTLASSEPWRHVEELRPQVMQAKARVESAQAALTTADAVKHALRAARPIPENLAEKLLDAEGVKDAAAKELERASAAYKQIGIVYVQASDRLKALAPAIGEDAVRAAKAGFLTHLDQQLAELVSGIAEQLTALCVEYQARKQMANVDGGKVALAAVGGVVAVPGLVEGAVAVERQGGNGEPAAAPPMSGDALKRAIQRTMPVVEQVVS